ncbi:MAG: M61 family metallopeptidase [Proteobacteria bacterium]|nr:M61 family metallopeptidase [Pseudomonadota bacterium]
MRLPLCAVLASLVLTVAVPVAPASAASAPVGPLAAPPPSRPVATPLPPALPAPQDVPYPGAIALDVDASATGTGVYRVTETIPVAPGTTTLTLLYPRWLPGNHAPRGPLAELVGLSFTAGDAMLEWTRDPVEPNAFHITLPPATREVVARFVHTSPLRDVEGRISMTRQLLDLQWEKMSLYPAGYYVRQVRVRPSLTLPTGWAAFTALDGARQGSGQAGARLAWSETDYETLVDSPVMAGAFIRRHPLGDGVFLDLVADRPELLNFPAARLEPFAALVREGRALFGGRHFDHYDFLVALSERLGDIGLEHHRSTEIQLEPTALADWAAMDWDRNVLPHEYVHSWNGKFLRPEGLWTPDYQTPMQDRLLWVYEGQTKFWGWVLAARTGIQTRETVLGAIATDAAALVEQPGRAWRSLEDTTYDPVIAARKPKPFPSLARGEDYYSEGALVWLEVDQTLREGTGGKRGLDDFARAFFGQRDGDLGVVTYTRADVIAGLQALLPYDWAGFFHDRIDRPGAPSPLAGIERGGYRLVWKDEPNPYDRARMAYSKALLLTHSLGLSLDREGRVAAAVWDGPAMKAGIVPGMQVMAVNGTAYAPDVLTRAIAAARGGTAPLQLQVRRDDTFATIDVAWQGGLRYPWLEPVVVAGDGKAGSAPEPGLDRLLAARTTGGARGK